MYEEQQKLERSLLQVKQWLETEPTVIYREDADVRRFIYGCKYDIDKVKRKLKNYSDMKRQYTDWFSNRDPTQARIQQLLDLGVFCLLPGMDADNNTVVIVHATKNTPRQNPMTDVFKVGMMIFDLAMELDESLCERGVKVIVDLTNVGLGHAVQLTPQLIKKAVHAWQDCYPVKIKSMDFIHCPAHVNVVLNIFKQFMREKLRNRVSISRNDLSKLHQRIRPIVLPQEYGGEAGSVCDYMQEWKNKVLEHREWFLSEDNKASSTFPQLSATE